MAEGTEEFRLRSAKAADSPAIRELVFGILAEFGLSPDPAGIDQDLDDVVVSYIAPGGMFAVLESTAGTIEGCVGIFHLDDEQCELRKMYLRTSARHKGQGRRLLEHAIQFARDANFNEIVLETNSVLKVAIEMYERYGFTKTAGDSHVSRCDTTYSLRI